MPAFRDNTANEAVFALTAVPSGTPASEVAQQLLDLFTSGSIEVGTRLPPERKLAAELGVGRSAVREALSALEILGIVDVRPGSGTYLQGTASDLLPQSLRWGLLIGEKNTEELLDLRSGLEIYVARLAALHAAEGDLEPLRASLEQMRTDITALDTFAQADSAFHHELTALARNGLLTDLLHVVRSLLRVYTDRAVHSESAAKTALEEHEAVFRAVQAGDHDAAASAMAVHMATATARLSAALNAEG